MAINDASFLKIVETVDGQEVDITPPPKKPAETPAEAPAGKKEKGAAK